MTEEVWEKLLQYIDGDYLFLFSNYTLVSIKSQNSNDDQPMGSFSDQAMEIIKEFGSVTAGTVSADMNAPLPLDSEDEWWLVTYPHCNQIFNVVRMEKDDSDQRTPPSSFVITDIGREYRMKDTKNPVIMAVEHNA